MRTYPLRVFVKRILLVRLALATAGIALLTGTAAYFAQPSQLERQVEDLARRGVAEQAAPVIGRHGAAVGYARAKAFVRNW